MIVSLHNLLSCVCVRVCVCVCVYVCVAKSWNIAYETVK